MEIAPPLHTNPAQSPPAAVVRYPQRVGAGVLAAAPPTSALWGQQAPASSLAQHSTPAATHNRNGQDRQQFCAADDMAWRDTTPCADTPPESSSTHRTQTGGL